MRVAVVGASGNAGTSVLQALEHDDAVEEVVGIARRRPTLALSKTTWERADVDRDDLVPLFRGVDCVVHLAWKIQPSHDLRALRLTNVVGSERVFRAVAEAGVPALVYASSVGAYSRGPKDRRVDESWPTGGTPSSFYARHKAEVERLLDRFERERPETRVVRLRPGLIFKRSSAEEQRRYFLGPLFPRGLARPDAIPVVPDLPRLRFQAVHSLDVGEAYRLAVVGDARGAFNVAAEPVLDAAELARARRPAGAAAGARGARSDVGVVAPPAPADAARLARHGAERAADGHDPRPRGARLGAGAQLDGGDPRAARRPAHRGRRADAAARPNGLTAAADEDEPERQDRREDRLRRERDERGLRRAGRRRA